jgi:hypothetical protein
MLNSYSKPSFATGSADPLSRGRGGRSSAYLVWYSNDKFWFFIADLVAIGVLSILRGAFLVSHQQCACGWTAMLMMFDWRNGQAIFDALAS